MVATLASLDITQYVHADHIENSFLLFIVCVCLCHTVLLLPCSPVVTCWEVADLLALLCLMFSYVLSVSDMVSRVRCGT